MMRCAVAAQLASLAFGQTADICVGKCRGQADDGCCYYDTSGDSCQWCPGGHVSTDAHSNTKWSANCYSTGKCDAWTKSKWCGGTCGGFNPPSPPSPTPPVRRQSRWWFNIHNDDYVNQMVKIVKAHRASITGVWMYCGLEVNASGTFLYDTYDGIRLDSCVSPIVNMGATAGVSINVNQDAIESGAALGAVHDIVAAAKKHRVTSIMVDYETHKDITQAHAQKYANFLSKLSTGMHREGMEAAMCVSSWGIMTKFGLYAKTGVDSMMTMASTYFGRDVSANKDWVTTMLNQGTSLDQAAIGVGTMQASGHTDSQQWDYKWSSSKLHSFVSWLQDNEIRNLDIWRSDIDSLTGAPEQYFYDYAEAFLAGKTSQASEHSLEVV